MSPEQVTFGLWLAFIPWWAWVGLAVLIAGPIAMILRASDEQQIGFGHWMLKRIHERHYESGVPLSANACKLLPSFDERTADLKGMNAMLKRQREERQVFNPARVSRGTAAEIVAGHARDGAATEANAVGQTATAS